MSNEKIISNIKKAIKEHLDNNYKYDMLVDFELDVIGWNSLFEYINELQQENRKQKEIIDETINAIDLVIELIKQQPTEDDRWILDRLNGFKIILEYKEVSE